MMEEQSARQAQGTVDLLRDAVQAGAQSIGAAHQEIAELPYAILRRIPVIARPARRIGQVQMHITGVAYRSVGMVAGAVAAIATLIIHANTKTEAPAAPQK